MRTRADRQSLATSATEEGGGTEKMSSEAMNAIKRNQQPVQFQTARQCGARTKSGKPCRSPARKKAAADCTAAQAVAVPLLASGMGQYRHGERTKAAIAEQRRFGALLKMLRDGLT